MIVITHPTAVANEINTIHQLFEHGLELLHIRKPEFSASDMQSFVKEIGSEYAHQLVLHSHHQLAEDLGISRLHFTEKMRQNLSAETLYDYNEKKVYLSASAHSILAFNELRIFYQYAFLSPVFPSISKSNYQSETDLLQTLAQRTNFNTKLVALGGIDDSTMPTVLKAGFDEVAVLGTIWLSSNPIQNFKSCQQIALSY
ncbi:thiamine phosphate synthase [Flavobacterium sp. NG2]|uniref:thiamine phosphate synthase n=1 Tax=Flavobacterium sp. NG2 TaxID=3097547 RepID=UPI002A7FA06A|nr:thiamine phosphate synthase [Flavobacterium sp. NG2]WPR71835.1 thiamine phosphate synthase [Flavobacterium sp. NG2]